MPAGEQARQYVNRSMRRKNRIIKSLDDALEITKYKPTEPSNAGSNTR